MRRALVAVSTVLLASPSLAATRVPLESWGKAGVSVDQYRADAIECGRKGYYQDISGTDDAKAFVTASREFDTATQNFSPRPTGDASAQRDEGVAYANQFQQIVHNVHVERRFENIGKTLQSTVDQCLTSKGYRKFRLTKEQRHDLSRLPLGTDQRRAYMYRLASDPAVLGTQGE